MACTDCQKAARKQAIFAVIGGLALGTAATFLVLRYVRK